MHVYRTLKTADKKIFDALVLSLLLRGLDLNKAIKISAGRFARKKLLNATKNK